MTNTASGEPAGQQEVVVTTQETYKIQEWKNDRVMVIHPRKGTYCFIHESQIPNDWPEKARGGVARFIRRHRSTEEHETRANFPSRMGLIGIMSVEGKSLKVTWPNGGVKMLTREQAAACTEQPERIAFLNKHSPVPVSNEVTASTGFRFLLRWHNGRRELTLAENGSSGWIPYDTSNLAKECNAKAEAWFGANCPQCGSCKGETTVPSVEPYSQTESRSNCESCNGTGTVQALPANQYRIDGGAVLTFGMLDDGHAAAYLGGKLYGGPGTTIKLQPWHSDWFRALHAWRDAEVKKWDLRWFEQRRPTAYIAVSYEGKSYGIFHRNGFSHSTNEKPPEYLCKQAEQMWKEREPEWRTEWVGLMAIVGVYRNEELRGTFNGHDQLGDHNWPPNILAEAKVKFRKSYELKPNELWFQGLPVKMRFIINDVLIGGVTRWSEDVADPEQWATGLAWQSETERLEGFHRACAYYYDQHPGKGLTPKGSPVEFAMDGDVGVAKRGNGSVPMHSNTHDSCVNALWKPLSDKLRKWTAEQIARRTPSMVAVPMKVERAQVDGHGYIRIHVGDTFSRNRVVCVTIEMADE